MLEDETHSVQCHILYVAVLTTNRRRSSSGRAIVERNKRTHSVLNTVHDVSLKKFGLDLCFVDRLTVSWFDLLELFSWRMQKCPDCARGSTGLLTGREHHWVGTVDTLTKRNREQAMPVEHTDVSQLVAIRIRPNDKDTPWWDHVGGERRWVGALWERGPRVPMRWWRKGCWRMPRRRCTKLSTVSSRRWMDGLARWTRKPRPCLRTMNEKRWWTRRRRRTPWNLVLRAVQPLTASSAAANSRSVEVVNPWSEHSLRPLGGRVRFGVSGDRGLGCQNRQDTEITEKMHDALDELVRKHELTISRGSQEEVRTMKVNVDSVNVKGRRRIRGRARRQRFLQSLQLRVGDQQSRYSSRDKRSWRRRKRTTWWSTSPWSRKGCGIRAPRSLTDHCEAADHESTGRKGCDGEFCEMS